LYFFKVFSSESPGSKNDSQRKEVSRKKKHGKTNTWKNYLHMGMSRRKTTTEMTEKIELTVIKEVSGTECGEVSKEAEGWYSTQ
jgi:hypothetical protein